ncbi:MAG: hypothetical protein ACLUAR_09055 [Pilosibacter sp.]
MYNRHIRHLVTELGNRLSDKEFLKRSVSAAAACSSFSIKTTGK